MTNNSNEKHIKLWTPADYHIEVEGLLAESWSDRMAGMRITARKRLDQTTVDNLTDLLNPAYGQNKGESR